MEAYILGFCMRGMHINRNETDPTIKEENGCAHSAPITALNYHPAYQTKAQDFSKLFLTSSMDWSMKLWDSNDLKSPLLSFDTASDYILDLHWNPMVPHMFGCSDADGYVDIWDVLKDREIPRVHYLVEAKKGLCKMKWSPDAKKIAVGSTSGAISLLQVDKEYTQSSALNDDCVNLDRMFKGIQGKE